MKKKLIWFNLLLLCSFESILNLVSGIPKIAGRLFYYTLNVNTGHHRHCYLTFLLHFCFLRQTVGGLMGNRGRVTGDDTYKAPLLVDVITLSAS